MGRGSMYCMYCMHRIDLMGVQHNYIDVNGRCNKLDDRWGRNNDDAYNSSKETAPSHMPNHGRDGSDIELSVVIRESLCILWGSQDRQNTRGEEHPLPHGSKHANALPRVK